MHQNKRTREKFNCLEFYVWGGGVIETKGEMNEPSPPDTIYKKLRTLTPSRNRMESRIS